MQTDKLEIQVGMIGGGIKIRNLIRFIGEIGNPGWLDRR